MSEHQIVQIVHVPNTDHTEGGLFALCGDGELLAGHLGYVDGRLKVEWTHVPVVDPVPR